MSVLFDAAGTQRLVNSSAPITTYPFTVGFWAFPTTIGTARVLFSLADTGTTSNWFRLLQSAANAWSIQSAAGGAADAGNIGTVAANQWYYVIGRFISATSRRIAILHPDGSSAHVEATGSRAPTGIDTMSLGASVTSAGAVGPYTGRIAEFFYTDTDIQPDGAQLQEAMLWQLASRGPFSLPHIAKDIVEYRSLRVHHESRGDQLGEVYWGKYGRQTWAGAVASGAIICPAPHPPLSSQFVSPKAESLIGIV